MRTLIIGAGASGLAAAITLKRSCPRMDVVLVEKLAEPGRKILATGNGRCNLSNTDVSVSCYHGDSSLIYTKKSASRRPRRPRKRKRRCP